MMVDVKSDIQWMKEMVKKTFDYHYETGFFSLRFYLLGQIVETMNSLEALMR